MLLNKIIHYQMCGLVNNDNYNLVQDLLKNGWLVKNLIISNDRGGSTAYSAIQYVTVVLEKNDVST